MAPKIREYFPGSNTPAGFYSYYDYILKSREASRIIVLKGGPGTGKSSFMRRVAARLAELGHDTELLHCSSDPNSLDGICAREIGFLMLDGTSPHIVDPKTPGAVDEIINLGDCWNADRIRPRKEAIIRTNEAISGCFARAYNYLSAAKSLQNQIEHDYLSVTNPEGVKAELEAVKKTFGLGTFCAKDGTERKAFLGAITPLGRVNYIDTFAAHAKYVYLIESDIAPNCGTFFSALAGLLTGAGLDIRTFYCPMSPDSKIEHIYVPALDVFFTTKNTYHTVKEAYVTETIDLNQYVRAEQAPIDTAIDLEYYNTLLSRAIASIAGAKKLHDELEQNYIPYMDFEKVEFLSKNVIESLH